MFLLQFFKRSGSGNVIISSIVVKRIGLLFPRAGNGKRNRQQGYGRNIFEKIEMIKVRNTFYGLHSRPNTQHIDRKITLHPIRTFFRLPSLCGAWKLKKLLETFVIHPTIQKHRIGHAQTLTQQHGWMSKEKRFINIFWGENFMGMFSSYFLFPNCTKKESVQTSCQDISFICCNNILMLMLMLMFNYKDNKPYGFVCVCWWIC